MIAWKDLKVVGPDGEAVNDDAVRAAALALAFAAGTVKVLAPSGDEVLADDVDWRGVEATGAEPIHGRDQDDKWARASIYGRELVSDPRFDGDREIETEEVEA